MERILPSPTLAMVRLSDRQRCTFNSVPLEKKVSVHLYVTHIEVAFACTLDSHSQFHYL